MRGLAVLIFLLSLALADTAHAKSVTDPDIGWPVALREELGLRKVSSEQCTRDISKAGVRLQGRIYARDPDPALYLIFHDRPRRNIWGNSWFDACDGGRLGIGVAGGGSVTDTRRAVRAARAYLARRRLTKLTRLFAVRSSYRELSDASEALGRTFADLLEAGLISTGIDTTRNTIIVDVARGATAEQAARVRAAALAAPVNVVVHGQRPGPATYRANIFVDRAKLDRASPQLTLTIPDDDCGADETHDSPQRFAGVQVVKGRDVWQLTARFRTTSDPTLGISTCEGNDPALDVVRTTITLPGPVGKRAIVDGTPGPTGFRFVLVPPVGQAAIRRLVPRFIYGTGGNCEVDDVRAAFRGRPKSDWCFF